MLLGNFIIHYFLGDTNGYIFSCVELRLVSFEENAMTKILLTGSAGLIGRALAPLLLERGYKVLPFDNSFPETTAGYGDITRIETLRRVMPDHVWFGGSVIRKTV